ncbi:hypothetical protein V500_00943 [Pseudogymnoascus sp. VKM F-4518 (FW-2643)]|nr:hypothetical protein V500_00943 [Pseudogymnoascus sp. VKM F-4518 (FW-2643)]
MTTFNDLPYELRVRIWQLTVEPRRVEVRVVHYGHPKRANDRRQAGDLWSTTPVPAPLQVCYEARNMGLYKQFFYELSEDNDSERRHVWVNPDIDLVDIGWVLEFRRELLPPIMRELAPMIRRLHFGGNATADKIYRWEHDGFVNVEEAVVVCDDGADQWCCTTQLYSWPCSLENIFFVDTSGHRVIRGTEMEILSAEMDEREVEMEELVDEMDEGRQLEMETLYDEWAMRSNRYNI